ncbi:MAG: TlpA family protein disulfide reductase [Chloroflexi bacterium]|nr:MAG: TlpA family protein disulfide reductase [Chloroflexota bacterium]
MRQTQPAFHREQPGISIPRNSLWIALLWFVALSWSLIGAPPNGQTLPPSVENAHTFEQATLDGSRLALADLRGRWVVVNFWATWCLPCREEMAFLQELAVENPEKLVVLGVNMRESPEDVRAFLADTGVSFPILLDPDDGTLLAYDVRGLPLTAVIGPDGALLERIVGPLDAERFSLDTLLYPSKR